MELNENGKVQRARVAGGRGGSRITRIRAQQGGAERRARRPPERRRAAGRRACSPQERRPSERAAARPAPLPQLGPSRPGVGLGAGPPLAPARFAAPAEAAAGTADLGAAAAGRAGEEASLVHGRAAGTPFY
ncbi:TPA: hypothetical protein BOS_13967 [Bos taurus]|nr:TPA: hypothetical protein BOS_13967 [Bos taurus]